MNQRGLTLLEALVALGIMGLILAGITPTFLTYLDSNTHSEERTGGVAAAQEAMEQLRRQDPSTLPSSGSSAVQLITVGDRDFEVVTLYCSVPGFCNANSRHLLIEVSYGGRSVYSVESVYTLLR